jgi:hypothetical protein
MTDAFPVYRAPGGIYAVGLPGQELPRGQMVGAIVFEPPDLFEAYVYALKPGQRSLGVRTMLADALKLYRQRPSVPPPPPSRFARRRP